MGRVLYLKRSLKPTKTSSLVVIPFCVMTSPGNHDITVKYFKDNSYFGLPENEVLFFPQGQLPAFDFEGKVLLETRSQLSLPPDGNGGVYPALQKSGVLKRLKEEFKVEYLHVFGVDTLLIKPADPYFV